MNRRNAKTLKDVPLDLRNLDDAYQVFSTTKNQFFGGSLFGL